MVILYEIIKMLTFPGALLKGFLEHLFCRLWKVPVEYSDYMQRNELCGHVEHLLAPHKGSFAICFGPHLIMLLLGSIIAFPGAMNLFYLGTFNWLSLILLYVGVSFLTNAFPLVEDALNMWSELFSAESKTVSKVLLAIPAAIMYVGAYLERYCVTLLTSLAFAYARPWLVALILG